jgi:hypothetical protein
MEAAEAGVTMALDVDYLGRALANVLSDLGRPIVIDQKENGEPYILPIDCAAAPDGLLPVVLIAAEAVFREGIGQGFGIELERDTGALFGYRVKTIAAASLTAVMVGVMEALDQAAAQDQIMALELGRVWEEALARVHERERGEA